MQGDILGKNQIGNNPVSFSQKIDKNKNKLIADKEDIEVNNNFKENNKKKMAAREF